MHLVRTVYSRYECRKVLDYDRSLYLKHLIDTYLHRDLIDMHSRGKEKLSDEEVIALYTRRHLPVNYLEATNLNTKPGTGTIKMVQLADIFSKPEMSLMASVMDLFMENDIQYQPESLYYDISKCIGGFRILPT